ncbi:MAG: hypothetical protein RIE06_22975 [Roseibium album]|uniref:hypothetical protein n=1 Tax=Roseibium album TaxID=311410 RepID=UPI0032ED73BB
MYGWQNPYAGTAFSQDPSGKKHARIKDDAHLTFIRQMPSLISGIEGCEACHVRYGDPRHRKPRTGKGVKPDDAWTVPLLPEEHRSQHTTNEQAFWKAIGIDPLEVAVQLYAVSGDIEAGWEIVRKVRASINIVGGHT